MRNSIYSLQEMEGDLRVYFNWTTNVLMPIRPGAADIYLKENREIITNMAQDLLEQVECIPERIYRGIILKQAVDAIKPHGNLQYLSFSTDRSVAEHFADVNGFGSEIMDVASRLGNFGYVIEHTPKRSEILFHHHFLSMLPYGEAFTLYGMDGKVEVDALRKQKEVVIHQPAEPFTNLTTYFDIQYSLL